MRVLTFIVNGDDVTVKAGEDEMLEVSADRALFASENLGRPFSDWEIRNELGGLVGGTTLVGTLPVGARFFLTLQVGYGGNRRAA